MRIIPGILSLKITFNLLFANHNLANKNQRALPNALQLWRELGENERPHIGYIIRSGAQADSIGGSRISSCFRTDKLHHHVFHRASCSPWQLTNSAGLFMSYYCA
jgi:hypothetical protein